MSDKLPRLTRRQREIKKRNISRQADIVKKGNKIFDRMEAKVYDGMAQDFGDKFFDMTNTARQQMGLKQKTAAPAGGWPPVKAKQWNSKCCGLAAVNFKTAYAGGKVVRDFRCKECGTEYRTEK